MGCMTATSVSLLTAVRAYINVKYNIRIIIIIISTIFNPSTALLGAADGIICITSFFPKVIGLSTGEAGFQQSRTASFHPKQEGQEYI